MHERNIGFRSTKIERQTDKNCINALRSVEYVFAIKLHYNFVRTMKMGELM